MDLVGPLPKSARDMNTSSSSWIMRPGTLRPSRYEKPPPKRSPRSCSCCTAGSAYQKRYWLTRARRSCPGWWRTSVASYRWNISTPPSTSLKPMGWSKGSIRRWSKCSVEWLRTTRETGTRCCHTCYSGSGKSPRPPPDSLPSNCSSGDSPGACSMSPGRLGSSSQPPIGPRSSTWRRWGSGSSASCP